MRTPTLAPAAFGIHLQYRFESLGQRDAQIENPLFSLLSALQEHGSIRHAAKALDLSYRHVWGSLRDWEQTLGEPLVEWVQGRRAQLTPFAQRLMWAERQARVRMTPHVEALRAELHQALQKARDPRHEMLDVVASHDLGLPRLQSLASRDFVHLTTRFAGSEEALLALNQGRCGLAGFHLPRLEHGSRVFEQALRPLLEPGRHKLIGCHQRVQGLMLAKGLPRQPSIEDLATTTPMRFVNRQPGSGTRLLMDHLLAEAGIAPTRIDGYFDRVEYTHVAVAATIASGAAEVGLGVQAAAAQFGLDFLPLATEDYYLVCLEPALETEGVRRVRALLATSAWPRELEQLPGYRASRPGEVLSLVQALPWWRFDKPRPAKAVP